MHTTFEMRRTWTPEVAHILVVVVKTVAVLLLLVALSVATGLIAQELSGGPSQVWLTPEAGLDL